MKSYKSLKKSPGNNSEAVESESKIPRGRYISPKNGSNLLMN